MATLAAAVEACRARIEDQTTLERSKHVGSLRTIPDSLIPGSFDVWPGRTTNARAERASGGSATFVETVDITLANRLRSAAEIASVDTLLGTARSVRVALTAPAWWKTSGIQCMEYASETRQRREGWVIITQTYRMTRRDDLG